MGNSRPDAKRSKEVIYWIIIVVLISIFFIILVVIIFILSQTAFESGDIYAVIVLIGLLIVLYFGFTKFVKSRRNK
jgi:high-affinity K+ transport system ATPase subunit B